MQGWGTVGGNQFYFRARWAYWAFSVSEDPRLDPVYIWDSGRGFYVEGSYGKTPYDAGYMPEEEAEAIIRRCAAQYLEGRR
ncbi:MAG TPA: hypothetical protein VGX48_20020 [Pyrinomonadaceae bacterium]|nr:hypothetical protein [Pyrinomonadaceae bacterium]